MRTVLWLYILPLSSEITSISACKVTQVSLGFRIPHPWIPDSISGWIPDFKILFWLQDSITWISDSITRIRDSGLPYMRRNFLSQGICNHKRLKKPTVMMTGVILSLFSCKTNEMVKQEKGHDRSESIARTNCNVHWWNITRMETKKKTEHWILCAKIILSNLWIAGKVHRKHR